MRHPASHDDGKLLGVQAARGIAALMVVIFHAERAVSLPQYLGHQPLGGITGFGHAGVDFFFVLSGFIIYTVHSGDIGRPGRFARYAGRRVSRIYPPYWVVTAIVLLIILVGHGWDGLPGWTDVVGSLLLAPHGAEPILGVAWTLEREMIFYLLFGLAILNRRAAVVAIAAWVGLTCLAAWMPGGAIRLGSLAAGSYDMLFAMGLATAQVLRRATPAHGRLISLAGAAAFLAAGAAEDLALLPHEAWVSRLTYGAASCTIILGLVAAERRGRLSVGRGMVLLGAASYSIYLVHTILLGLTTRALTAAGAVGRVPGWAVMAAACLVAAIAGIVFHLLVERPATRAAQRLATRLLTPERPAARAA